MAETRPTPEGPKRAPKMIRVIFKPGTSTRDMAETLVRLQDEVMAGKEPPKSQE